MMMSPHRRMHQLSTGAKVGGILLVVFAGVLITVEVMLHVMAATHDRSYHINYWMLLISCVTGFTGLYILSPPRAKDGGQFLVNNAIRIIQVIKAGRRKGDPMTAIVEDMETGMTASVLLPPPVETEVPITSIADGNAIGPNRRASDAKPSNGDQGDAGNRR